ncbi:uncharacterized protein LOC135119097 [Helicoverpa armigera]|uniref:uncharacterized protein LOC135119097 n=1 Tax=Helicoverpa armigera TaxID=29058 RepID=UPI003082DD1D
MWMCFDFSSIPRTTWLCYMDLIRIITNDFGFVLWILFLPSTTTLSLESRILAAFDFGYRSITLYTMPENHCVNCGFNLTEAQEHTLEPEEISVIQQWVAPRQVSRDNLVCHNCWLVVTETFAPQQELEGSVRQNSCINCGRSVRRIRSHSIRTDTDRESRIRNVIMEWIQPREVSSLSRICHPCWHRADRAAIHFVQESASTSSASTTESEIILPSYTRAANTERCCIFPDCHEPERMHIPTSIRVRLLCDLSFYVPQNCRICNFHLTNRTWDSLIVENGNHTFTAAFIEDLLSLLKNQIGNNIDFENIEDSDDHLVYYWLGMSKHQFRRILEEVPRLNNSHRGATGLAAYLTKLRTGDSDQRLSTLFKVPRSTLERLMNNARELLTQDFVPQNLGLQHVTRENIAQRNLIIPNGLFGSTNQVKPIVIMDGTYVYIQKSSNYKYQKQTYSLHKFRNLMKPFIITCCDGYILDVMGPYPATTSDAEILKNEFSSHDAPMRRFFEPGDVFILDRGFRDAIPLLTECGYSVKVPASLEEGESQLSTIDANNSRKVTICRWVVEVINGVFKQTFKLFRQEFFNRASTHMMQDFAVGAALINRFHPRILDRPDAAQILSIINERMYIHNTLADYINLYHLNRRRAQFVNITVGSDNLNDFPRLTMDDLILIACGTYQIKQARSYYGEHIRANGMYSIEICREQNSNLPSELLNENCWLLRAKIQSRHVSRKIYFVYPN